MGFWGRHCCKGGAALSAPRSPRGYLAGDQYAAHLRGITRRLPESRRRRRAGPSRVPPSHFPKVFRALPAPLCDSGKASPRCGPGARWRKEGTEPQPLPGEVPNLSEPRLHRGMQHSPVPGLGHRGPRLSPGVRQSLGTMRWLRLRVPPV